MRYRWRHPVHLRMTVWRVILYEMEKPSMHRLAGIMHGAAFAEKCARQLHVAQSACAQGCFTLAQHFRLHNALFTLESKMNSADKNGRAPLMFAFWEWTPGQGVSATLSLPSQLLLPTSWRYTIEPCRENRRSRRCTTTLLLPALRLVSL